VSYKKNYYKIKESLKGSSEFSKKSSKIKADILKYIKCAALNPNILVIFDDIVPIMKSLNDKINLFFMEGRHYNITTILSS
jgi:hypothetical protein